MPHIRTLLLPTAKHCMKDNSREHYENTQEVKPGIWRAFSRAHCVSPDTEKVLIFVVCKRQNAIQPLPLSFIQDRAFGTSSAWAIFFITAEFWLKATVAKVLKKRIMDFTVLSTETIKYQLMQFGNSILCPTNRIEVSAGNFFVFIFTK